MAAAGVLTLTPVPAQAAPPEGACTNPDPARPAVVEQPWAQRALDPASVWRHSTGAGVLVAVVDSGVDADHPQLRADGKVLRGQDFYLVGDLPGNFDCVSHGTAVASIVAASRADGVGFSGIAPGARILPVRISERDLTDNGASEPVDPAVLARGIWYAADQGAKVINLSLAGTVDDRFVRDAVAYARSKDALVIAAAGNAQEDTLPGEPSYPAGYEGVLGVGAVEENGQRLGNSQIGPQVDLVAPGGAVLGATRAGGHEYWQGTSFATAFVSGTAALVRAAWPELSADEVARRLVATATPAPGGADSQAYGAGLVNPARAVSDGLSDEVPRRIADPEVPEPDPDAVAAAAWWDRMGTTARLTAGAAGAAAVAAVVLTWLVVRGRRGRFRARRAEPPAARASADELPEEMFLLPRPAPER
ncbi:type VII secretion-associated serine protease mycosin [Prauserella sp. ASG 168]|uniref:Type VII secretion-associated serine protease mycosin n=2 Tax=Prauserella cavernicola TaxID=2800127 RepID=A0A934QZH8_9PSEU|nr:type VII secretion-associated serine protease mycosin [Prauserella cavernicola]